MLDHESARYDEPVRGVLTLAQGFSSIAAGEPGSGVKSMVLVGVQCFGGEQIVIILRSPEEVDQIIQGIERCKQEVWGE